VFVSKVRTGGDKAHSPPTVPQGLPLENSADPMLRGAPAGPFFFFLGGSNRDGPNRKPRNTRSFLHVCLCTPGRASELREERGRAARRQLTRTSSKAVLRRPRTSTPPPLPTGFASRPRIHSRVVNVWEERRKPGGPVALPSQRRATRQRAPEARGANFLQGASRRPQTMIRQDASP